MSDEEFDIEGFLREFVPDPEEWMFHPQRYGRIPPCIRLILGNGDYKCCLFYTEGNSIEFRGWYGDGSSVDHSHAWPLDDPDADPEVIRESIAKYCTNQK